MRNLRTGRAIRGSLAGHPAVLVAAAGIAVTAALLTACGTARPASTGAAQPSPSPAQMAQASGPPSGSRAEALSLARQLLSRLVLPPGSQPDNGPLPASLRGPAI